MDNITNNNGYKILDIIAYVLVSVGAINWGLIGLLDFDIVLFVFKEVNMTTRIIYGLIGLCGIRILYILCCKACNNKCQPLE